MDSSAFDQLLECLDNGENSDGARYLEIRGRLVAFFDRKSCRNPDELADETLNRVARRLTEVEKVDSETPAKFCYLTAKFVFLESLRHQNSVELDENVVNNRFSQNDEEVIFKQRRFDCLENCTDKLELANREIIIGYYFGEERIKINNRRELAKKFEISTNALSIRACRIREKLQICMEKCVGE